MLRKFRALDERKGAVMRITRPSDRRPTRPSAGGLGFLWSSWTRPRKRRSVRQLTADCGIITGLVIEKSDYFKSILIEAILNTMCQKMVPLTDYGRSADRRWIFPLPWALGADLT